VTPPVAVPETSSGSHRPLEAAVRDGGGRVAPPGDSVAVVWPDDLPPRALLNLLQQHPGIRWVQLTSGGVDRFAQVMDPAITWTSAKGVTAFHVAELAVSLVLAGFRNLHELIPATSWSHRRGRSLRGASVTILGGGGIAQALVSTLAPWECDLTIVRRTGRPLAGASRTCGPPAMLDAASTADVVVVAMPLTPSTRRCLDRTFFSAMRSDAWFVNVARGDLVVTEHLVAALEAGSIAGCALDVTAPEPLPDGHALWTLTNAIVTPHLGTTPGLAEPLVAQRVLENVSRFVDSRPLLGLVDPVLGY
jgi:phosphoglycerate dehydrogenase-like enzyme